jgi:hypothetical protein
MTDKKISELSSNGTLDGTESTVLVQSGSNVKALLSTIRSYIVNGYLTTSTAASTYQTTSGMSSYLTTSTASSTYQTTSGMSSYLTTSTASSTYQTIANSRYQFVTDDNTTYIVPASAVTANGNTIIELSNNSLTSITVNTATGTGKSVGDSVNISITGTYAAQVLVASGVTLQGDLTFSYQYETKTLVYKGSNTWKVVG